MPNYSWATMGQVCYTAISSKGACPTVFIALSSVYQIIVLCACCPSVPWVGLRAKVPSSLRHCTTSTSFLGGEDVSPRRPFVEGEYTLPASGGQCPWGLAVLHVGAVSCTMLA